MIPPRSSERWGSGEEFEQAFESLLTIGGEAAANALPFDTPLNPHDFVIVSLDMDMLVDGVGGRRTGVNVVMSDPVLDPLRASSRRLEVNGQSVATVGLAHAAYEERYADMMDGLPARWSCHVMKRVSSPNGRNRTAISVVAFRFNSKGGIIRQLGATYIRKHESGLMIEQSLRVRDDTYRRRRDATMYQHGTYWQDKETINPKDVPALERFVNDFYMPIIPAGDLDDRQWLQLLDDTRPLSESDLLPSV